MPLARVRVVAVAGEPLAVEVNGSPLPDGMVPKGVSVQLVDGVPQIVLAVSGEARIEGEGIVVVQPEAGDEIEYLRQFIGNLDPDELDRRAIAHAPTLASKPGEGYKAALLEMIGP